MYIKLHEIHIWSARLDVSEADIAQFRALLNAKEISRADRFQFEIHRRRFIAAHGILRKLLSLYLQIPPAKIEFEYSSHHKPYLTASPIPLMFNMSHSEDLAIFGLTLQHEIGVDIEKIATKNMAALAKRFFSDTENRFINTLANEQQKHQAFYEFWARKEALLKAIGKGLSIPLHSFSVTLEKSQTLYLEDQEWSVVSIEIDPQFSAAVASKQPIEKIIKKSFFIDQDEIAK